MAPLDGITQTVYIVRVDRPDDPSLLFAGAARRSPRTAPAAADIRLWPSI